MSQSGHYPRYQAPSENGQKLSVPPWTEAGDLLASNCQLRANFSTTIAGCSLKELALQARRTAIAEAIAYTSEYVDVDFPINEKSPTILIGHQPELVHPGVWLKNFAAHQLAQNTNGVAISLIVDSDICRKVSIPIPTGFVDEPHVENVNIDLPSNEIPFEERRILDRDVWNNFGSRASKAIAPLLDIDWLRPWWSEVAAQSRNTPILGYAVAQARHSLEWQWGNRGLELPLSRVCQTAPFRKFAIHLLCQAAKFRDDYNAALADYRRAHSLRNRAQPVPDLMAVDGWVETPFWIWTKDNPQRRALYIQSSGSNLALTDRLDWQDNLHLSATHKTDATIAQLENWEARGTKLRTRVLATTMYARMLLADLFIHGIGGAKYDQVTNEVCRRFFGHAPPPYVTLSGTLRLPITHQKISLTQQREISQHLRELRYHPESHLSDLKLGMHEQEQVQPLVAEKMAAIRTAKTSTNGASRHQRIVAANEAMQPWYVARRAALEDQLQHTSNKLRANRLLESREYPFCLFPRDHLRNFLLDFSSSIL